MPAQFAGHLPRIRVDDPQRLLGMWLGLSDHARLIQTFDEDWFRNPHAIDAVLGQLIEVRELRPSENQVGECAKAAAGWLIPRFN